MNYVNCINLGTTFTYCTRKNLPTNNFTFASYAFSRKPFILRNSRSRLKELAIPFPYFIFRKEYSIV